MELIEASNHHQVHSLWAGIGAPFPIIDAVLYNIQDGQVFADSLTAPAAALVVHRTGFCMAFGEPSFDKREFSKIIVSALEMHSARLPQYLLWYDPPDSLGRSLQEKHGNNLRIRERVRWTLENPGLAPTPAELPPQLSVRKLVAADLPGTTTLNLNLTTRFWKDEASFLERSMACGVINDEQIVVSVCYAAAASNSAAEIDVATLPAFSGRGLATASCLQFIKTSLERNIHAKWDCFANNDASMALAKSLGFAPCRRYNFYSFPLRPKVDQR